MRFLQVVEKLVIILGVGLAVFPLWAWIQETEDRQITRSAMRLAAYEYCFRMMTQQDDLVADAMSQVNWSPAAVEAAAYAEELVQEECGHFQRLASIEVASIEAPEARPEVVASLETPSRAAPASPAVSPPPGGGAPSATTESFESFATPALEDDAFEGGAAAVLERERTPVSDVVDGAGAQPLQPSGRLSRGDYVVLDDACGGHAIALGQRRVMCADGSSRLIDPDSHAPISATPATADGAEGFERLVRYFTN